MILLSEQDMALLGMALMIVLAALGGFAVGMLFRDNAQTARPDEPAKAR